MVVHVGQRAEDLDHHVSDELECDRIFVLSDAVEELASLEQLHHDEDVRSVQVILVNFDHIDMVDFDQQVDFLADLTHRDF